MSNFLSFRKLELCEALVCFSLHLQVQEISSKVCGKFIIIAFVLQVHGLQPTSHVYHFLQLILLFMCIFYIFFMQMR